MSDGESMIHKLLSEMSEAEKVRVLQSLVRDLTWADPGIASVPGVSGGEPCIVRTRIPVWMLVQSRNLGMSEAEILANYPTLTAEDLVNAWNYYRHYSAEIERQIADNEAG